MRYLAFIILCGAYTNLFGSYDTQKRVALVRELTKTSLSKVPSTNSNGTAFPLVEIVMSYLTTDPLWVTVKKCSLERGEIYSKVNKSLSESRTDRIIILRDFVSSWGDGYMTRIAIPAQYHFDITEVKNIFQKQEHTIYSQCGNAQICHNSNEMTFLERMQFAEICNRATRNPNLKPFYIIKEWLTTRPGWLINWRYNLAGENLRDKKYLDSL